MRNIQAKDLAPGMQRVYLAGKLWKNDGEPVKRTDRCPSDAHAGSTARIHVNGSECYEPFAMVTIR